MLLTGGNEMGRVFCVADTDKKFLDIKLINLNRQTLPLNKRLDEKNREVFSDDEICLYIF